MTVIPSDGSPSVSVFLQNNGVGPAKIESLEIFYKGKALTSGGDFLTACCTPAGQQRSHYVSGSAIDRVIAAKDGIVLFRTPKDMRKAALDKIDATRHDLRAQFCYCSVLDECWFRDSAKRKPERVKACPEPKTAYNN